VLNSDAGAYGGSGMGNFGGVHSRPAAAHGRAHSLALTLPPLATVFLEHQGG
jgi:1,4-alpha-glucan branching enzyme